METRDFSSGVVEDIRFVLLMGNYSGFTGESEIVTVHACASEVQVFSLAELLKAMTRPRLRYKAAIAVLKQTA